MDGINTERQFVIAERQSLRQGDELLDEALAFDLDTAEGLKALARPACAFRRTSVRGRIRSRSTRPMRGGG